MEGMVASQGQMAREIRIKGLSLYKYVFGFNDLAYFYRVFKKQTGLTLGEFLHQGTGTSAKPKR
jgi:YesN/AraC family two-component response regulator